MTSKKPFPSQLLGVIVTIIVLVGGYIATFARNDERLKQVESRQEKMCNDQKEVNGLNSEEHKKIMSSLTRIETLLERPGIGYRR